LIQPCSRVLVRAISALLASGFLAAAFASAQNGLKKASAAWRARSRLTTSATSPCSITKNIRKKESKHEEHDIPGCVTDMLSSIYYVASLPLLPGKTYNFLSMMAAQQQRSWSMRKHESKSRRRLGLSMRFEYNRKLHLLFCAIKGKSGFGTLTMRRVCRYKCARGYPGERSFSTCCG